LDFVFSVFGVEVLTLRAEDDGRAEAILATAEVGLEFSIGSSDVVIFGLKGPGFAGGAIGEFNGEVLGDGFLVLVRIEGDGPGH